MRTTTLIANRNYQEFLPEAIKSYLSQNYDVSKMRLCIVDASDDFDSVLEIYKTYFPVQEEINLNQYTIYTDGNNVLIKCHDMSNLTPSRLRNIGIEFTKDVTDVYFILDADDKMLPNKISRMIDVIRENPDEVGVVYADHLITNYQTKKVTVQYREPYSKLRLLEECIVHSNSAVTTRALLACKDEFGYYDETMRTCEDYDLWMRISKKFMIVHLAEILSDVLVQPKNSSVTVDNRIWEQNWRRVHEKNGKKI